MRTTIDLPGELVAKLKLRAAAEGVPMKVIYNRAFIRAFGEGKIRQAPVKKKMQRTQPSKSKGKAR